MPEIIFAGDDDDPGLASDNMRAIALKQLGKYSRQDIIEWMCRNNHSLESAANALGISRRVLAYYRSGERDVPKTVGLAMLGWEIANKHVA